jgi:hypothetical protein
MAATVVVAPGAQARLRSRVTTSPWATVTAHSTARQHAFAAIYNGALRAAHVASASDSCDWGTVVKDPIIDVGAFNFGDPKRCGIEYIENLAYDLYAAGHNLPPGDPRIELTGQNDIAGIVWSLLQALVTAHANYASALTADQQDAYDWLHEVVHTFRASAANDALAEYNKWKANPCGYKPPDQKIFPFNAAADPACGATLAGLFAGPSPPSYSAFVEYGQYEADKTLGLNDSTSGSQYDKLKSQQLYETYAPFLSVITGAAPKLLGIGGVEGPFGQQILNFTSKVLPNNGPGVKAERVLKALQDKLDRIFESQQQGAEDLQATENLAEAGAPEDSVLDDAALQSLEELTTAGIDAGDAAVEFGTTALTGPFFIFGFAAAVAVQEGIKVFNDAKIPGQLQDDANAANQELNDLITGAQNGQDAQTVLSEFESQLSIANPTIGSPNHVVTNAPFDGSEFEVSLANDSGATVDTSFQPTVQLATWPLGIDQGVYGVDHPDFAIYHNQIWQQVNSNPKYDDLAAAGLSGWVPSGELHYFDWQGNPRIALVDGDHFIDFSSPGSNDLGGNDIGPLCQGGDAECHSTNVLFALEAAGGVNPSYTTDVLVNGDLQEERIFHPSDGKVKPPYIKVRLTLKPDPGAQALTYIENQWGLQATTVNNPGQFEGGLLAGDKVHLVDLEDNPLGYPTTYTWKIESRCAYQQACTPDSDPAFHGNPAVTLTGKGVDYTWPSPGVYHVRLITSDQYGTTQQSDEDVTIAGSDPTAALGSSSGFAGAVVFGPIQNVESQTITGCIDDSSSAYDDPHLTIDWGDGTTSSGSGRNTGTQAVTFNYGTTSDCPHLWQFSSTHQYNLTPPGVFQVQKPMHITLSDAYGGSTTINPFINIQFPAPPTFTSADNTTFPAGSTGNFKIATGGLPTPTVSIKSGSLPSGIGFVEHSDGTATISGAPNPGEVGSYPITLQATSSQGTVTQSFTFTVTVPPSITSASSKVVAVNHASTVNFAASGTPSPTFTVNGALPPGMTVNGASITGTPTATGTYPLSVTASNSAGNDRQAFTLVVGSVPAFTSANSTGFVVNASPSDFKITTSGTPTPSITCDSPCTLPTGLQFHDNGDGTAEIFGTATAAASDQVTLTATNGAGSSQQTLTVVASPTGGPNVTVTSGATFDSNTQSWTAPMTEGSSATVNISSNPTTVTLSEIGDLPSGVNFTDNGNGTATISGTPAAGTGGWYGLVIKAHPSSGTDGLAFVQLEVEGAPTMTSSPIAVFTAGQSGSFKVTASGLPRASVFTNDTLPTGLTFDGSANDGTATISGTPAADQVGRHTITVQMENLIDFQNPVTAQLTIDVYGAPAFTSSATPGMGEDQNDSFTVTTTGYPAAALQVVGGTVPPGITFTDNGDGTGTFSGTPTDKTNTSYPVLVQASSPAGTTTQAMTIGIGPAPTVDAAASGVFATGSNDSFAIASSATPHPAFTASGLPSGLHLTDNGDGTAFISGTPDAGTGGSYPVQVTATNPFGQTTKTISLTVNQAPTFAGTEVGLTCQSSDPNTTSSTFFGNSSWTLCASGYPTPHMSVAGNLPAGITFKDNGDGSAVISGTAAQGTGGPYLLTLTITTGSGRVTQALTLNVDQPVQSTSTNSTTFVAGQANTYVMSAIGYPIPTLVLNAGGPGCRGTMPSWLSFKSAANGQATVGGTPPDSAVGQEFDFRVDETQGIGNGNIDCMAVTVAPLALVSKAPPAPTVGGHYSYKFTSTDPSATYRVAPGQTVPAGLTLSSSGVLSGTPTTVGTWVFSVVASDSKGSATGAPITLTVKPAPHQLEIRAFRTYGPGGTGDWFVTVHNTTSVTMPLFGWRVAVFFPGLKQPIQVPLAAGNLGPGGEVTAAGTNLTLPSHPKVVAIGPSVISIPGGFEVFGPDGSLSDRAGEAGGPKDAIAGTGVPVPGKKVFGSQSAFERKIVSGKLANTGNNARDFVFTSLAKKQTIRFLSKPPRGASVGGHYKPRAVGGRSGKPVKFSAKGACKLRGSVVTFTRAGTCVITATQAATLSYSAAAPVHQRIKVRKARHRHKAADSGPLGLAGSASAGRSQTAGGADAPRTAAVSVR